MGDGAREKVFPRSRRVYGALLRAYPAEFRREFGREMSLVFHDRCREACGGAASLARVWCGALFDLARTAPAEWDARAARGGFMRIVRTVLLALAAYAFALLVAAPLYTRYRESMPPFVANLVDALIATGVIFNFIFLVLTLAGLARGVRAVRLATLVTAFVVAGLITLIVMLEGPPAYPHPSVVVAQVVGLFVWFVAHVWWVLRRGGADAGPPAPA